MSPLTNNRHGNCYLEAPTPLILMMRTVDSQVISQLRFCEPSTLSYGWSGLVKHNDL